MLSDHPECLSDSISRDASADGEEIFHQPMHVFPGIGYL